MSDILLNPFSQTTDRVSGIVAHTKPFPLENVTEPVYYFCPQLNHHMHRTDGKRLAFVFHILVTKDKYDIAYLDNEIDLGNPYIRHATEQEIDIYKMRTDPRGTMEQKLTPEIEARVRSQLSIELQQEMEKRLSGINLTPEQKEQLAAIMSPPPSGPQDSAKLEGVDRLNRLGEAVREDNAIIHPARPLSGIVGTDKLPHAGTK